MNRRSAARIRVFLAMDCVPQSLPGDEGDAIECDWLAPAEIDGMIAAG